MMATNSVRSFLFVLLALGLPGLAAAADPDPPARVGRASLVEGDVAYLRDGEWAPLPINWPITTGTRVSAAPGARAELRIGSTAIRLASATELEVTELDDDAIALRVLNGTIDARVRNSEVAQRFSVATPEARGTLLEPGRFRFETGVTPGTTAVSADLGAVRVEAGGNSIVVQAGKRAEVSATGDLLLADLRSDAFDDWARARDQRADASQSARYVSPETTGYESLDAYGDWRDVPQYGPVWVPRAVPVGWAPYRAGRWAWIEPWGWTWIDEAPWGFAPFHYGRWAFVGGVWAWAPGRVVARPVYAPALVGWVGRPGWSVSVSIGTVPAVGWFPLAPREVYVPAYRHSPAYVRNVNVAHVTSVTQITNVTQVTNVHYANRHIDRAVTVVPAAAVTSGQPIARSQIHVRRAELDRNAPASPTPTVAAVAPPRPAVPHAARDERGPSRQFDPAPRTHDAARGERRDERQQDRGTPTPTPAPASPPAHPTPPRASDLSRPAVTDRAETRGNDRVPDTPPRVVETRPGSRAEPPRTATPAALSPSPAQAPPHTDTRPEPRREVQRVEPPRASAPAPQVSVPQVQTPPAPASHPPQPQTRTEPRSEPRRVESPRAIAPTVPTVQPPQPQVRNDPRSEPRRVEPPRAIAPSVPTVPSPQPQLRNEPRPEPRRIDPPRAVAPPAPAPAPSQPRPEPRAAPPAPAVHAAPPAPAAAVPAPQPQQSAPRGDRERGQAREQRRSEGRGNG